MFTRRAEFLERNCQTHLFRGSDRVLILRKTKSGRRAKGMHEESSAQRDMEDEPQMNADERRFGKVGTGYARPMERIWNHEGAKDIKEFEYDGLKSESKCVPKRGRIMAPDSIRLNLGHPARAASACSHDQCHRAANRERTEKSGAESF